MKVFGGMEVMMMVTVTTPWTLRITKGTETFVARGWRLV